MIQKLTQHRFKLLLAAVSVAMAQAQAQLLIVPQFDSSVTSAPNGAEFVKAFNYAAQQFSSLFGNNLTVNVTVSLNNEGGGSSVSISSQPYTYSELRDALVSHSPVAGAGLPAADPFSGSKTYELTTANALAIGLPIRTVVSNGGNTAVNGEIYLQGDTTYAFRPSGQPIVGTIDFVGVAEHEISEVLGRTQSFDNTLMPYDLYRFTGPGERGIDPKATGVYFSLDQGTTKIRGFNSTPGADLQDWNDEEANDAFNAAAGSDPLHLSNADVLALEAIGYTPVPEPASYGIAALGVLGFAAVRAWKRR